MSSVARASLLIKDHLFERLKQARLRLGIKQSELAEIGGVSRATQVSYESNVTSPNTDYLRLVQSVGLDIPFVLFGDTDEQMNEDASEQIDWKLVQEAVEAVNFFCIKAAPNCPDSYKWQLVKKVYASILASRQNSDEVQANSNLEVVRQLWEKV